MSLSTVRQVLWGWLNPRKPTCFAPDKIKTASRDLKGVGLISIRQWVSAMEGTMSIESQPGKVSRGTIDIPLAKTIADA